MEHYRNFASRHVVSRHVDVWLPPGYHAGGTNRFPVVYMHDGQNLFAPALSYGGIDWGVDETLSRLIRTDQAQEALVVGIWNTPRRWQEYLPQRPFESVSGRQALARLDERVGDGPLSDAYLRFLATELKPFIDERYRTLPDRAHTFVMGSSMGGLVSLYALCEYPELLGGAGCLSTHWPAVDGVMLDYLERTLPPPGKHKLYFDYGTETLDAAYEPHQRRVDRLLQAAGYRADRDWMTRRFEGAEHSEQAWRARVHIPLTFLLGGTL